MSGPNRDFNALYTKLTETWARVQSTTAAWKENPNDETKGIKDAAVQEALAASEKFVAALKVLGPRGGTRRRKHRKTRRRGTRRFRR